MECPYLANMNLATWRAIWAMWCHFSKKITNVQLHAQIYNTYLDEFNVIKFNAPLTSQKMRVVRNCFLKMYLFHAWKLRVINITVYGKFWLQSSVTQLISMNRLFRHINDAIMGAIASQITNLTIVYSTVYWGADQRKHQSPASLVFVRGINRWPVNSPHKWPVTRKMFPFDDVTMTYNLDMRHTDHVHLSSVTLVLCVNVFL